MTTPLTMPEPRPTKDRHPMDPFGAATLRWASGAAANVDCRLRIGGSLLDQVPTAVLVHDASGRVVDCNAEAVRLFALPRALLLDRSGGDPAWRMSQADGTPLDDGEMPALAVLATGRPLRDAELTIRTASGREHHLVANAALLDLAPDEPPGVIVSFADVTGQARVRAALEEALGAAQETLAELEAYRVALDAHAMVAVTDRHGIIVSVNGLFCRISGYARDELVGQSHAVVDSDRHPRAFFESLWSTVRDGRRWHGEICNRAKDGSLYWVDSTVLPLCGASGEIESFVVISYDITARKQAESRLAAEAERRLAAESLLRDVLDALPDAVAAFDADDRLAIFNRAFRRFYALTAPAIRIGARYEDILRYAVEHGQFAEIGETPDARATWIEERLARHRDPGASEVVQLADGRWLQLRERRSAAGNIVGVRTDISKLKAAEATIKRQAESDPLTGLANRGLLFRRLQALLGGRRRHDPRTGCFVLIDLDHFKEINDTHGHDIGDAVLCEVAQRLREAIRATDTAARLGGDEFAVILGDVEDRADCTAAVEKIVARLGEPFAVGDGELHPEFSVGVGLFPEHGDTPDAVFKSADMALYEAKAAGRRRWRLFDPVLREQQDRRHDIAAALRWAIAEDELTIALQPQVRLASGRHEAFEAFVRWPGQEARVTPGELVRIAEETGLIVGLGDAVVARAARVLRRFLDAGHEPGRIAVNAATLQLKSSTFLATVRTALAAHALPPERLEVEVTELMLHDRSARTIGETMRGLRGLGVSLALDDFGTGHASLAHLTRFAVQRLKIDQSFVQAIGSNHEAEIIVRTIISLAHSLGMEVVAEGIETAQQLAFLRQHGCDLGQGFHLSPPLDPGEAEAWLARA